MLLGDVVELRDRPIARRWTRRRRSSRCSARRRRAPSSCSCPGNHDHHLFSAWSESRRLARRAEADGAGAAREGELRARSGCSPASSRTASSEPRLPGDLARRGRLRDPRPLPRRAPDRADLRAARGRRGRAGDRRAAARGPDARRLRAGAGAALRLPLLARPVRAAPPRSGPGPSARLWAALGGGHDRGEEGARAAARLGRASRARSRSRTGSGSAASARTSRSARSAGRRSRRWSRPSSGSRSTPRR